MRNRAEKMRKIEVDKNLKILWGPYFDHLTPPSHVRRRFFLVPWDKNLVKIVNQLQNSKVVALNDQMIYKKRKTDKNR